MSSILSRVHRGKVTQPHLWIVYGVGKVGKSSLVADAPSPIVIGPESGTANLDVSRLQTNSFREFMDTLNSLLKEEHDFKTVAVDSLDWLEHLVWEHVVENIPDEKGRKVNSIEDYGWNKGYVHALAEWRKVVNLLQQLREKKKMHVVLIAHPHSKDAKDPTVVTDYNRYQLKLNDKAAALFKEFVDCVFFINYESMVATDKKGKARAVAFQDAEVDRYIYTVWSSAWDAGNRFGLAPRIPYEKGKGWEVLDSAIAEAGTDNPESIRRAVNALLAQVSDDQLKANVESAVLKAGDDAVKLDRIRIKLQNIVNTPAA